MQFGFSAYVKLASPAPEKQKERIERIRQYADEVHLEEFPEKTGVGINADPHEMGWPEIREVKKTFDEIGQMTIWPFFVTFKMGEEGFEDKVFLGPNASQLEGVVALGQGVHTIDQGAWMTTLPAEETRQVREALATLRRVQGRLEETIQGGCHDA